MPIDVPSFIKANAQRGLDYNREGKGGDGLTDKTLDEARELAQGFTTESKLRRMPAWFARHKPDLEAPANKPGNEDFPGAGAVAWLIWGGSVSGNTMDAADWAEREVAKLDREAKAFDSRCNDKMLNETSAMTPEAKVEQLASSLSAIQTEKIELQKSFEALASEKMAAIEEATKLKAEYEAHKLKADAEKAELAKLLADAQATQVSASKEAAKVISSLGMKPVDVSPADKLASEEVTDAKGIWATFLKMPAGADKQAYFRKHKATLDPLNLS